MSVSQERKSSSDESFGWPLEGRCFSFVSLLFFFCLLFIVSWLLCSSPFHFCINQDELFFSLFCSFFSFGSFVFLFCFLFSFVILLSFGFLMFVFQFISALIKIKEQKKHSSEKIRLTKFLEQKRYDFKGQMTMHIALLSYDCFLFCFLFKNNSSFYQ